MFNNVGGKIKTLAQVLCWLGIIGSVIAAIAVFKASTLLGFLILIFGPLSSWVSNLFLYGFGELIDNTDTTRYYIYKIHDITLKKAG